MSEKKSKTWTAEFKEPAVKLAVEFDRPVTETAKDPGVNVNTLHTWIGKYHQPRASGKGGKNDEYVCDDLKRLRKEVVRLKEELGIFKKAGAFFARESL